MAEEEQDVNEDEMNGEDDISEVRKCQLKVKMFLIFVHYQDILYLNSQAIIKV